MFGRRAFSAHGGIPVREPVEAVHDVPVPLREGKAASAPALKEGERLYFTWTLDGEWRVVRLVADDASLEVLKKEELDRINARVARDGVTGYVEAVDGDAVQFLVFSSGWFQANQWKPGQLVGLRAVVHPRRFEQGDGFGHGAALHRRRALHHPLQKRRRGHATALRICSSTSFALAGIGVPGP